MGTKPALTALMLVVTAIGSGCGADTGAGAAGSCAFRVAYAGRIYEDVSELPGQWPGAPTQWVGHGTLLGCQDADEVPDDTVEVRRVPGLRLAVALAVPVSPREVRLLAPRGRSAEVRAWLRVHRVGP